MMDVDEAAAILGVPADADLELLKQTHRKLALAWHPDKCTDPKAKEKFLQISIAYTKLISSRSDVDSDDDEEEDGGHIYEDDVHEMRAFMRMFMDLVGIFNEDQVVPDDEKVPGVSFGMMFGAPAGNNEDWSSEEEEEEDCDDEYDSDNGEESETMWEPMVKHYFHMNLKEEAKKARADGEGDREDESEAKRKQRNAKKRAEKRRKQKEKRTREAAMKAEEDEKARLLAEEAQREQEEKAMRKKEEARRIQEAEDARRAELFSLVSSGQNSQVVALLEASSAAGGGGVRATEREGPGGKSGAGLLHACVVTNSAVDKAKTKVEVSKSVIAGKLCIAKYLLSLRSPVLDLGLIDENGCAVTHLAAIHDDISLMKLLLEHNRGENESSKKHQPVDINSRCLNFGFTPLHYAAGNASIHTCQLLLKSGALLNIHAYPTNKDNNNNNSSDTKGPTPLEHARHRLKELGSSLTAAVVKNFKAVIAALEKAMQQLENARILRENDKSRRESKLNAERERQAAKEQTDKELLERKQRQLKEKQDKLKEEEEARTSALLEDKNSSAKKKKKKKDKKKGGDESSGASSLDASRHVSASEVVSAALHNAPSSSSTNTPTLQEQNQVSSAAGSEVTSRDELLDHLLAMGFVESDCLQAIIACGLNVDRAISWLCEPRPPPPTPSSKTKASKASTSSNNTTQNKDSAGAKKNSTSTAQSTSSGSTPSASHSLPDSELTPAQKAQKDKDHKEELRRINREWNARVPHQRAEEEKKKAEEKSQAERAQKELERQRVLQQQLQAQYSMHSMFTAGGGALPPGAGPITSTSPPAAMSAVPSFSQQQMPGTFTNHQQRHQGDVKHVHGQQAQNVGAMSMMGAGAFPLMPSQQTTSQQPSFSRNSSSSSIGSSSSSGRQSSGLVSATPSFSRPLQQQYPPQQQAPSAMSLLSNINSNNSSSPMPPGLSLNNVHHTVPMNNTIQSNSNSSRVLGGGFNSTIHSGSLSDKIVPTTSSTLLHQHHHQLQQPHQPQTQQHTGSSLHNSSSDMPLPGNGSNSNQTSSMFGMEDERMRMPFMNDLNGNNSLQNMNTMSEGDEYVDGGLNLSAGARPFVPQFATSPSPQLSLSPPQHPSSGTPLGVGGAESLALPSLGSGSQTYTPVGHGHDWNADINLGVGGGNNSAAGSSFLWQGGSSSGDLNMNMNNTSNIDNMHVNNDVDDSGFDMAMNLDLLGGLDDLLQPPISGGGSHGQRKGSLLEGLVSVGGSESSANVGGMSQQQISTSRFLNLGGEDDGSDDITGGDFFQPNNNSSTILSSSLNDFMTNMGDHHNDFSSNNDIQSVFSSNTR